MNRRITVQDGAATRDRELSGPTEGATATDLPAAIGQENAATAAGETPAQHGTSRLSPKPDSRPGPATKDEQIPTPPRPHTRNPRPPTTRAHRTGGEPHTTGTPRSGSEPHAQRDGRNRPRPDGKTGFPIPRTGFAARRQDDNDNPRTPYTPHPPRPSGWSVER